MKNFGKHAAENLVKVRQTAPLIHNITNFVVMNPTANALLAMGASPVMAHAENEVEEMVSFSGALVLNIGTLTNSWIESMIKAGKKASELKTPVILDPVGAGATSMRTNAAEKILDEVSVRVIRGNATEILALGHHTKITKGVDSIHSVEDASETARRLAIELNTTLAITGPVDLVTNGEVILCISNGHRLMSRVTGTGCSATAVIGAFLAVDPNPVTAAATALAFYGLAGEMAGTISSGPGSFQVNLLDALYAMTPKTLEDGCRIQKVSLS